MVIFKIHIYCDFIPNNKSLFDQFVYNILTCSKVYLVLFPCEIIITIYVPPLSTFLLICYFHFFPYFRNKDIIYWVTTCRLNYKHCDTHLQFLYKSICVCKFCKRLNECVSEWWWAWYGWKRKVCYNLVAVVLAIWFSAFVFVGIFFHSLWQRVISFKRVIHWKAFAERDGKVLFCICLILEHNTIFH